MLLLALDIGSSSVKAGVFQNRKLVGRLARVEFATRYDGERAEVEPDAILTAVREAVRRVGRRRVDLIVPAVMSPAWVAMDGRGNPITPIVTHQDRRSIAIARQIEKRIGKDRHLRLAGNRPFPGGISSTTCAWFLRHERARMRRADVVGHLNTFLHRRWTGARVTDPSNASFMGLYRTLELSSWSDELCGAIGIFEGLLPEVREANEIGGTLSPDAARELGLLRGTPMLVGLTDTGSAMLFAGAAPGQVLNVSGSTDVLAVCTNRPRPHERLLTRALGVGRRWLSVGTLASAGSTIRWVREQFFADLSPEQFEKQIADAARRTGAAKVQFEPYLAGDRTSIEQPRAAFGGLTLATTRRDMLEAVIEALARASAQRLYLLRSANGMRFRRDVIVSGGVSRVLSRVLRRDWPGKWRFRHVEEATLRGLACLADRGILQ